MSISFNSTSVSGCSDDSTKVDQCPYEGSEHFFFMTSSNFATFQKNAIGALRYKTCEKISIGSSTAEEQTAPGQVVQGSNHSNYCTLLFF